MHLLQVPQPKASTSVLLYDIHKLHSLVTISKVHDRAEEPSGELARATSAKDLHLSLPGQLKLLIVTATLPAVTVLAKVETTKLYY